MRWRSHLPVKFKLWQWQAVTSLAPLFCLIVYPDNCTFSRCHFDIISPRRQSFYPIALRFPEHRNKTTEYKHKNQSTVWPNLTIICLQLYYTNHQSPKTLLTEQQLVEPQRRLCTSDCTYCVLTNKKYNKLHRINVSAALLRPHHRSAVRGLTIGVSSTFHSPPWWRVRYCPRWTLGEPLLLLLWPWWWWSCHVVEAVVVLEIRGAWGWWEHRPLGAGGLWGRSSGRCGPGCTTPTLARRRSRAGRGLIRIPPGSREEIMPLKAIYKTCKVGPMDLYDYVTTV